MKSAEFNVAMERVGCPVRAEPYTPIEPTLMAALVWVCEELASLRSIKEQA